MTILQISRLIAENINFNNGLLLEDERLLQLILDTTKTLRNKLTHFGVNVDNLKVVGAGAQGVAYSDGKLVVKVTEDEQEAHSSLNLIGHPVAGVTRIHYVGQLGTTIPSVDPEDEHTTDDISYDRQFYIIIQDLVPLEGLTDNEKKIADLVGNYLSTNYNKISWPASDDVVRAIYNYSGFWQYGVRRRKSGGGIIQSPSNTDTIRQLLRIVGNLNRRGIKFYDVSAGNIGKDYDDNIVIFDIGISASLRNKKIEHIT